jgi:pimeloyl-ACP methyl ester carboxylesterase
VAGAVRYRWAPLAGLAVVVYLMAELVANGAASRLLSPIGPVEVAGGLALAVGLVLGFVAGIAALVGGYLPARPSLGRAARWRRVAAVSAGLVGILALAAAAYVVRNVTYSSWDASRVGRAGFVEKQVDVNGSTLNYAEGPDNGPPLLLVHGQLTDWRHWGPVLPELSRRFHVFAVDCPGHGGSARAPEKYTARAIAADLEQFLAQVVGEPAVVAGHSSGGLVAAGLAAGAPDRVRGVVLEDPPFFSSVLPHAEKTINYVDLSTVAHNFLSSGETDFTAYYLRHSATWDLFGKELQNQAVNRWTENPGEPLTLPLMPPMFNELFAAMPDYDPRFGDAFYTGRFHQDFDHAATLDRITVPAVLIHTNWSYDDNGILLGAMDAEDAERARSLIDDVEFVKVDSGHSFHAERPDDFLRIVLRFTDRLAQ